MIALMFSGKVNPYSTFLLRSMLDPAACFMLLASLLLCGNLPGKLLAAFEAGRAHESRALRVLGCAGLLALYLLCLMELARGSYNPFIYFQF